MAAPGSVASRHSVHFEADAIGARQHDDDGICGNVVNIASVVPDLDCDTVGLVLHCGAGVGEGATGGRIRL